MGQRTNVIVVMEDKKNEVTKKVYHHQWGFGRNMYMAFLLMFSKEYLRNVFDNEKTFKDSCMLDGRFYDITEECNPEKLESIDINNIASIADFVNTQCDNNNGVLVVYAKEVKGEYISTIVEFKIGFLLGTEDEESEWNGEIYNKGNGKAFEKWLTPIEYGRLNGGSEYSDEKFVEIFNGICEYFDVKFFTND